MQGLNLFVKQIIILIIMGISEVSHQSVDTYQIKVLISFGSHEP
jgi:hypothetical protein